MNEIMMKVAVLGIVGTAMTIIAAFIASEVKGWIRNAKAYGWKNGYIEGTGIAMTAAGLAEIALLALAVAVVMD